MTGHRACLWQLGTCICCVLLTGCGGPSDPQSKEAAQFVLDKGGSLSIAGSSLEISDAKRLPQQAFAITEIKLNQKDVNDDDLQKLSSLTHLTNLELHGTKVTDKGLVHLASLPALTRLELSYTGISDQGLEELARFGGLQKLYLYGTDRLVTNEALAKLKQQLPDCEIYR